MNLPAPALELRAGDLRLALRPDLGGSIAGLWHGALPVLRSTEPAALASSRTSGCYPLVPYSNRLGYRRFRWLGKDHTTQPNYDDNPHTLHGVGWLRPWMVEASPPASAAGDGPARAELFLVHPGDADWPFAFEARQVFTLTAGALHVALSITNAAPHAAPVGLGWHPYFPKRQRSRIHAELSDRWESDAGTQLPTRRVPQPGIDGDVSAMAFDHCFEGWAGPARLRDEKLRVQLSSSLDRLVVYTPQTREYYCVEPVSHVSNAIHMADPAAHGLRTLQPRERFDAWMTLDITPV
jgi:aldose 1-epimerase